MNKEKYSIYDFPELLYNSKLLTNRQRCIVLCLFSFLNLKGGGVFTIDILAEKTGIKKNHIYEEIKNLFVRTPEGEKIEIIKRDGKKILLITDNLRKFIDTKLGLTKSPNTGPKKSQNGTKEVLKQDLESPNMGLKKSQNGTKKSPEAQETQKPEGGVNNILRKDFLDKNKEKRIIEGDNKGASEKSESDFKEKKEKLKEFREEVKEEIQLKAEGKTLKELEDTVLAIYKAFAKEYETRFGAPPALSGNEIRLLKKRVLDNPAYKTKRHLESFMQRAIAGIPNFFKLQDPWVRKQNYSFFAFIYRLNSVMPLTTKPAVSFRGNKEEYLKALGVL